MNLYRDIALLAGRILIAAVFIYDATLLVRFPQDNVAFMEQFGLPAFLLWPTALFQFLGGVLVIIGYRTERTALALAGFCILTALVFHRNFADTGEIIQLGKDFAIAGGFLFLTVSGAGRYSADAWRDSP